MNPIRELRGTKSRAELALELGVSYDAIVRLELGYMRIIPLSICKALAAAGHNADELQGRYRAWREGKAIAAVQVGV